MSEDVFFPFLIVDEAAKLSRLFSGYISLGQWECAKATVRQVKRLDAQRALELLLDMALNGITTQAKAVWMDHSVLSWLCYAEYLEQGGKSIAVPQKRLDRLEYQIAIASCRDVTTKEQQKLLERLLDLSGVMHRADKATPVKLDLSVKMSGAEHAKLEELIANSIPNYAARLLSPFYKQNTVIQLISSLLEQPDRCADALRFVPLLSASNLSSTQSKQLDSVLGTLVAKCKSQKHLIEALFASDDSNNLLARLASIQDGLAWTNLRNYSAFASLGDVHSASLLSGKHPFELVLEAAMARLGTGAAGFPSLELICTCFAVLRNLVLAMGAQKYEGDFLTQQALFDHLAVFELAASDPLFQHVSAQAWRVQMVAFLGQVVQAPSVTRDQLLRQLCSGTPYHQLAPLDEMLGSEARERFLALVGQSFTRAQERVALRSYFVICDVWRNGFPDVDDVDHLFGGVNSEIAQEPSSALVVCEFAIRHAARRVATTKWKAFSSIIRGIRTCLDAHPDLFEKLVLRRDLEDYEFRVRWNLGLERGAAQLLIDHALEERFDVCEALFSFYGAEGIASERAVEFWRACSQFSSLRSTEPLAQFLKTRLGLNLLNLHDVLDLAFFTQNFDESVQLLQLAHTLSPTDEFSLMMLKICAAYHQPLRKVFSLCRQFDFTSRASLEQQLDAEHQLKAALADFSALGAQEFDDIAMLGSPTTLDELERFSSSGSITRFHTLLAAASPGRRVEESPLLSFLHVLQRQITVKRLSDAGRFLEALQVADQYFGASDELLLDCSRQDHAKSWKYIRRMKDVQGACQYVLEHVHHYEYEDALDALTMCKYHANFAAASAARMRQLLLCHEISELKRGGVWEGNVDANWRHWDALLMQEGGCHRVMKQLVEWKQFELAKDVEICYLRSIVSRSPGDAAAAINIDSDALLHRLEHMSSFEPRAVLEFIEQLQDPVATVRAALSMSRNLEGRQVLHSFLCKRFPEDGKAAHSLVGVRILLALPATESAAVTMKVPTRRALNFSSNNTVASSEPPVTAAGGLLRLQLAHLEAYPKCIVETLILNEKVEELAAVLKSAPELVDDDLILSYARKALAIDSISVDSGGGGGGNISRSQLHVVEKSSSASSLDQNGVLRWVLTGADEFADLAMRRDHSYASAPSIKLATALLDQCASRRSAARACLDVCHQLSRYLSLTVVTQHLLILNLIKQLLFYAQLQFVRQEGEEQQQRHDAATIKNSAHQQQQHWIVPDRGGGEGGVDVCQSLLSNVDLLHDLYIEDCGIICGLEDFADPRRARALRDKLIEQDRIKLAQAVATQCSIESEPIWLAWGLCLLKSGDYEKAKEKISKCCEAAEKRDSTFDRQSILEQILGVLQMERMDDSASLRADLNSMEDELRKAAKEHVGPVPFDVEGYQFASETASNALRGGATAATSGSVSSSSPTSLDSVRYMQCIYYLTKLGTPTRLIRFWLFHGYLEDAIRYVIGNNMSEHVFISEILTHCLSYNIMPQLFACLPRVDPRGTQKTKYLVQAAKYLNEAHAFDLLLELQVFMQDWPRAGLTCVKLFHVESDPVVRLQYLKGARNHFSNALKEQQQNRVRRAHSAVIPPLLATPPPEEEDESSSLFQLNSSSSNMDDFPTPSIPRSQAVEGGGGGGGALQSPLSEAELSRYFRKVMLQISIVEFLDQTANVAPDEELRKLSMFGSSKDRIAERLVVLSPTTDLGFRMMQEFRLPQGQIYARAVRELVLAKRKTELAALLKQIKGVIEADEWDLVVLAVVTAFAEDLKDKGTAEKYIPKLYSPRAQVRAYRVTGLLKTAYILSAKNGYVDEIQAIRTAALQSGVSTVVQLCNSYLAKSGGL